MDRAELRKIAVRLSKTRETVIRKHPFLGRLLAHLELKIGNCETAYTDMKRIVFGPEFASGLDAEELEFLMLHEVMHCVLKHCTRCDGRIAFAYNVACDIVVNSILLEAMGKDETKIAGEYVMHLAPDGKEGREYTADEVYKMLFENNNENGDNGSSSIDDHSAWESVEGDSLAEGYWKVYVKDAVKAIGNGSGIPVGMERVVDDIVSEPKISWKHVLHDFIRHNKGDYTYSPPARRYYGKCILPSFKEDVAGETVEKVWFAVDTSGSVSDNMLGEVYNEIKNAVEQFDRMSGYLSFFDTEVTAPKEFESVEDISNIKALGGGGTSFFAIFDEMEDFFPEELPSVIIVMTDGYAIFPEKEAAKGVPVIWLITDSDEVPPWGEYVKVG